MAELDRAAICARIQEARTIAGLTQAELGDALTPAVHWRTIQTWESVKAPRVPWDRLDEIARVTGRSKEWLLHGDEVPAPRDIGARLDELFDLLASVHRQVRLLVSASDLDESAVEARAAVEAAREAEDRARRVAPEERARPARRTG